MATSIVGFKLPKLGYCLLAVLIQPATDVNV